MKRKLKSVLHAASMTALFCAVVLPTAARAQYVFHDLGTLGGTFSQGYGVNDNGHATGSASIAADAAGRAFIWDGSSMQSIGTLGGRNSLGRDINATDQVTGYSHSDVSNSETHAFFWNGSSMQDLGTLGGASSFGMGLNNAGQVAGSASPASNNAYHAFFWNGSSMQDLGTLGGTNSYGYGINAAGHVAGYSQAGPGVDRAFIWNGSSLQDIGTLGGDVGYAFAINDAEQATGLAATTGNSARHAYFWNGSSMVDIGTLGDESRGLGINNLGQIVGTSVMTSGPDHAFLWSGGTMTDLNAFAAPGWVLQSAQSISDTGYITGFGQFDPNGGDASDSVTRAFVLAPNAIGASVPEPGVIALGVGAASFGLALFRRRK